jgi:putative glutathione S-transferase
MGLLVNGKWHDQWYDTSSNGGEFIREDAQFRNRLSQNPNDTFYAESGRYHLFVSMACPWAHRTLIFRELKALTEHIGVTVVDPKMLEHGWEFSNISRDNPISELNYLHQLYTTAEPNYSGRVTVPVLWDKKTQSIVNNESAEIIEIFNSAFNHLTGDDKDFFPEELRDEIDELNQFIYHNINNGVYKTGFATSQQAYEKNFTHLFNALDEIEQRLSTNRFLIENKLTVCDWRLFTTLIRFDSVYYGHFKCNRQQIEDYPNMANYLRELYQLPGIKETCNFEQIKTHYYYSHTQINPTQVVPLGPAIDYDSAYYRPI